MFSLYQVTNLINGMYYIGVHAGPMGNYWGSGYGLKAAIKKYGRPNFRRDVLAEIETEQLAYQLERTVVSPEFVKRRNNYNRVVGGIAPPAGWNHTDEARRKIGEASKGNQHSAGMPPNTGSFKLGNKRALGNRWSEEARQKLSLSQTGRLPNSGCFKKGVVPAGTRLRLITWNGKTQCVKSWGRELSLGDSAIRWRLKAGWSVEKALTEPKWHVHPLIGTEG